MMLDPAFLDRPIAHRGLHDKTDARPENSMAAFQAAIDAGFGIELDVQLTRDGHAVVFHDYELQRLTGRQGQVRQTDLSVMQTTPLIGGDAGAPALRDVLDLVAGRVPLLVEVKDQDLRLGPDIGPLEAATAKAVQGYAGPLALMSFNPHSALALAKLAPDVPRGLVTCDYAPDDWPFVPSDRLTELRSIPDFAATGASFISHQWDDLDSDSVRKIKAQGHPILCWTIKTPQAEATARQVADNVTFEGYLPA